MSPTTGDLVFVAVFLLVVGIILGFLAGRAHSADLSSLQRTPVRLVAVERHAPEVQPFTPPPCVGIVWPVRMARCEVTVRF
jgi:hypothetical protein